MSRPRKRTTNDMIAVAYLRQSKDEDVQRVAIERLAADRGLAIVGWFSDVDVSGAKEASKRPGLTAALEAMVRFGAGRLIVQRRDRLARSVAIASNVTAEIEATGARVVTTDGDDGDDSDASFIKRGVDDVFAAYERRRIQARTRQALALKASRGERLGRVPFGWKVADDGMHLVPDADEQYVLVRIRALRAEGLTFQRIVDLLNSTVPAPEAKHGGRQGARWHLATVHRLANLPALEVA